MASPVFSKARDGGALLTLTWRLVLAHCDLEVGGDFGISYVLE